MAHKRVATEAFALFVFVGSLPLLLSPWLDSGPAGLPGVSAIVAGAIAGLTHLFVSRHVDSDRSR